MNLRNSAFAIMIAVLAMGSGCAAETDDADVETDVDSTESEAVIDCDTIDSCPDDNVAPKAVIGRLVEFTPATGVLKYAVGTKTYLATVLTTTRGRIAPLNFWPPGPIRPIAERWNALVLEPGPSNFGSLTAPGETFSALTSEFVSTGALMKVKLNKNKKSVKALRPVP